MPDEPVRPNPEPPPGLSPEERERFHYDHPPEGLDKDQLCGWHKAHTRSDPNTPICYASISYENHNRSGSTSEPTAQAFVPGADKREYRALLKKEMRRHEAATGEKPTEDQLIRYGQQKFGIPGKLTKEILRDKDSKGSAALAQLKRKKGTRTRKKPIV
jgi:hypothetical protein